MNDEKLDDLQALIGNVIRLAVTVEPAEAKIVCDTAECCACHNVLLEPRLTPSSRREHVINHKLLQAFVAFRREIELIRAATRDDKPATISFGRTFTQSLDC
jgi:hypothetical protein